MRNNKNRIIRIILMSCACLMLSVAGAHATTRVVTKVQDTNDGLCNADCSLREAINVAAPGDTINFSSLFNTAQTITLSPVVPYNGGLIISTSLTIEGPGADLLTVNGINNEVFEIAFGAVNISGMTIANGDGILNYGTLSLTDCIITDNDGGIDNHGALTVTDCTISENIGFGSAIDNDSEMTLLNSTISNNNSNGIINSGTLTVTNSTISGNGNSAGMRNTYGAATITSSTIANNSGTGIDISGGTVTVRNTIIANHNHAAGFRDISYSNVLGNAISGGFNLIGIDGTGAFNNLGDQNGTLAVPLDPLLDPLGDYGGMTETHRLQTNSTAIDKGYSFGSNEDQRGALRPFDKASYPNVTGGDGSDIGAYELQFTIVVTGAVYNYVGIPIKNARVSIRAANGKRFAAKTDRFGVYRFDNIPRNRTYQVSVMHRQHEFIPQILMATEELFYNFNFFAQP